MWRTQHLFGCCRNCSGRSTERASSVSAPKAAFFEHLRVRRIDRNKLRGRQQDEFLGHAATDETIGMVLLDQATIGAADLVLVRVIADAQDDIGIRGVRKMRRADAAELVRREAEN